MAGSHRERIESLEAQFGQLEVGLAGVCEQVTKMDRSLGRMERKMERTNRRSSSSGDSSSSTTEHGEPESSSEGELNPTRIDNRNGRHRREDDRRRGKPKLFCPTFDGADPITWLSRVDQYFDLHEIERKDKVRYAAYYLEGEANMWWQWLSRVYQKKGRKIRWKDFKKELLI